MTHTTNRDLTIPKTSLVLYTLFTLRSTLFGYYHSNHVLPTWLLDLSRLTSDSNPVSHIICTQWRQVRVDLNSTLQLLHPIILLRLSILHSLLQLVVLLQKSHLTPLLQKPLSPKPLSPNPLSPMLSHQETSSMRKTTNVALRMLHSSILHKQSSSINSTVLHALESTFYAEISTTLGTSPPLGAASCIYNISVRMVLSTSRFHAT